MERDVVRDAEHRMDSAIKALEDDLAAIRTGRASPVLVEKLPVTYYGTPTPLLQLATIAAPEARLLTIKPFDPATLKDIEKAILASQLGLTPNNDGKIIRLSIPPLTEERRRELVKVVHHRMEEARIAVRNVRRDSIDELREYEKEELLSEDELHRGQDELQKVTDRHVAKIDEIGQRKEREIAEV